MVYMERVRLPKTPSSWQPLLNAGRLMSRLAEESPAEKSGYEVGSSVIVMNAMLQLLH